MKRALFLFCLGGSILGTLLMAAGRILSTEWYGGPILFVGIVVLAFSAYVCWTGRGLAGK